MKTPTKLITIAAFIAVCACTNNKCTITGNVSGLEGEGWILLTDIWHDFNVIDSVRYKNGQFRFEIDLNGEIVRGAVPTGSGIYISSQIDHLQVSLLGTTREDVSCRWFRSTFMPGYQLKVNFDEFPVETLSVPTKTLNT